MENWEPIEQFPGYSVSDAGRVMNDDTGRILAISRNGNGVCHVGMMRDGRQYKRSLPLLVARIFVTIDLPPRPDHQPIVPIHLDGDQTNNQAANLLWRPHWFAIKYANQFQNPRARKAPIVERKSGDSYASPWEAATILGLLEREIVISILNRTFVWPTFQEFRYL